MEARVKIIVNIVIRIEYCIQPMLKANPDLKEEEARAGMMEWFPTLKRWKKVS